MNITIFIISIIGCFMFSFALIAIIPGGDDEFKLILGIIVFIVGEIAVCTNAIIHKIDEIKNKTRDI